VVNIAMTRIRVVCRTAPPQGPVMKVRLHSLDVEDNHGR
jgi:hypothetical protein